MERFQQLKMELAALSADIAIAQDYNGKAKATAALNEWGWVNGEEYRKLREKSEAA